MPLTDNSVTRHIDPSGDEIKAFLDDDGTYVQAVALVDENGDLTTPNNPYKINISQINGSAGDSFGRLRVSNLYPLFETTSRYDIDNSIWVKDEVLGGSVTHSTADATIQLSTDTQNTSSAKLVTKKNFRYSPGKSQLIMQTLSIVNPTEANCDRRWGYFDDNDGLFFAIEGGVFGVVLRSGTQNTFIPQTSFNRDTLNGNGSSGFSIDLTKANIYQISFQFLGVGIVEFGVYSPSGEFIVAHVFENANQNTYSYMNTAILPLKYECVNTGVAGGNSGINFLCATVNSEGSRESLYTIFESIQTPDFVATTSAAERPILSIQSKALVNTLRNKIEVVPQNLSIAADGKPAIIRIWKNVATLTNSSFTDMSNNQSSIQYDTTATAFTTDANSFLISSYIVYNGQSEVINLENIFSANKQSITYNNADEAESITITIQRASTAAAETSVLASLSWAEIR